MARGEGTCCITKLIHNLMPPLCEDGEKVPRDGDVLSQTMCLNCRTISSSCRWFRTEQKKRFHVEFKYDRKTPVNDMSHYNRLRAVEMVHVQSEDNSFLTRANFAVCDFAGQDSYLFTALLLLEAAVDLNPGSRARARVSRSLSLTLS